MNIYLIAKKLGHSFSKPIHNALSDYSYEYKELGENELKDFFDKKEFDGLNVTIPYKRTVMEFLDEISEEADREASELFFSQAEKLSNTAIEQIIDIIRFI